jgi:enterochelin esterase family protein
VPPTAVATERARSHGSGAALWPNEVMRTRWLGVVCLVLLVLGCGGAAPHPAKGGGGGSAGSNAGVAGATAGAGGPGGFAGGGAGAAAGASGGAGASGTTGTAGASADAATEHPSTGGTGSDAAAADVPPALDPGTEGDGDFTIGPMYTNAPELTANPNVPKGALNMFAMKSTDSKLYPGITGAYTRNVWVYVPAQYVPSTPAPFIIAQDGGDYITRLPVILDNMIAAHQLPVMLAVMANSGGGNDKGSERGLEYDTVSDKFVTFVETELLPKVATMYNLTFTTDPNGRATMGGSSGGAAAFTMGWFRPDLYRRILTYSGTYVNQESPVDPMYPHGAWEYHEHLIPGSDPKPLRVWLECGQNDFNANDPESTYHNFKMANQRMAAALMAKGYHYRFEYALGAQHNDGHVGGQTMPEALAWLWRGYPL